jgi:hypothetical protein
MAVTRVDVSSEDKPTETPATETPKVETPTETPKVETPTETPKVETPKTETPAPETQADLDGAASEFIQSGEVTEATLKALEAKGFTKAQITTYASGIKAQAEQATAKLAERVGGKDNLTSMLTWAKEGGLSQAEQSAYDSMMTSGNEAQMALAIDGLAARHEKSLGSSHTRTPGTNTPRDNTVKPFASNAEIVEAMRDPRYAKDPAYRAAVAARLADSNTIGLRH